MTEEIKNQDTEDNKYETEGSHEYDGIKELNNPAPNWILYVLMGSIFFSLIYVIHYFGYPDNKMDQVSEYDKKVTEFKEQIAQNNPGATIELSMEEAIAEGSKLYAEKGCLACHGMQGEGNAIGPNLTDNYWLNGCSMEDVIKIITEGNPTKGMTAYKSMMTEGQIKNLSVYILNSMTGSSPPNGKAAQGEECKSE